MHHCDLPAPHPWLTLIVELTVEGLAETAPSIRSDGAADTPGRCSTR